MINSPIDEIKARLDIVDVISSYIKLQKAGVNYRAVCPFHSEKSPSFFVSPSRQIWHCFGSCSEGGDMFKFVMKIEGIEFGDALRVLAQKAGIELKKQNPEINTERKKLYDISELACRFFEHQLEKTPSGKEVKKYLILRGITEDSIKSWRIGYSPDNFEGLSGFLVGRGYKEDEIVRAGLAISNGNKCYDRFRGRIMFPVFAFNSQVIGFGGRIFKEKEGNLKGAKYMNTPSTLIYDKSQVLYGLHKAGIDMRKEDFCILVEGYVDAIMVSQSGFTNVVATSGTALTNLHLKIIKRYTDNLFTAFDMDSAGDSATKKGIDLAQSLGFDIKIITMEEGLDPADIVLKDSLKWEKMVKGAKSIHDFYFENTLSKFDKETIEGKKSISKILLPIIKKIPDKIEQSLWLKDLAEIIGVKEEDVFEEMEKVKIETSQVEEKEAEKISPKTRKLLLEENLITLLIKSPPCIDLINDEDMDFFSDKILENIKSLKKDPEYFKKEGKKDETISRLMIIAELEGGDPKKEIKNCLKEIRIYGLKEKLKRISEKIKIKEKEKDTLNLQKLIEEFNHFSKLLLDLEEII